MTIIEFFMCVVFFSCVFESILDFQNISWMLLKSEKQ